jgi:hypothetical protein
LDRSTDVLQIVQELAVARERQRGVVNRASPRQLGANAHSRCVSDLEKKRTVTALTLVIARLDRAIQ